MRDRTVVVAEVKACNMLNNPIRITIVLALIVLGLGGYILFVDIPQTRQFQK